MGVPCEREHAPRDVRRIGVRVEVDDPELARRDRLRHGRGRWEGDRVVSTEHDRDRARLGNLQHLAPDHLVAAGRVGGNDRRVAGINAVEPLKRLDVELQRVDGAGVVGRRADGARPEAGPRPIADRVVERRADDRDVRPACAQRPAIGQMGSFWKVAEPT